VSVCCFRVPWRFALRSLAILKSGPLMFPWTLNIPGSEYTSFFQIARTRTHNDGRLANKAADFSAI